ncbi:MAG TPA: translational GTPase TypA [Coxiellaceae bacterium]|nr:MAG: GTP-binding protein TypA [Gammaproteobacteria bacterium RIFCSPHIGHO2_12_FULL_36_30]HLB56476.1 translational GTPase TypA [Coxiellaceae bacterium]
MVSHIRNVAIIAHVDHGKTTLVDKLLQQSGTFNERAHLSERMMDSNPLEQERGITILAKNTAIRWHDYHVNIVDTPGHADFGGEVERILSMVDSVLLLIDAVDGPMPQTRFVTQKAFSWGLKPIVVINKIDRDGARPDWAVDQVFDLFVSLDATDEQLDFPIVYTSALQGYATDDPTKKTNDMSILFQTIIDKVPPPKVDLEGGFQMQVSAIDYSSYVGAIGIGRVSRGKIKPNTNITVIDAKGKTRPGRILQIFQTIGFERLEIQEASAGDIISVTGVDDLRISDTFCDPEQVEALPVLTVDEPTVSMTFSVNNSPFAGKEGKYVTSRQIGDRLQRELIANVALRVETSDASDEFIVSGRGELHLSILIENMRREGYELSVSRPKVIQKEIDGVMCEPYEQLIIDVEEKDQGTIMQYLADRQADLKHMMPDGKGRVRLDYIMPTRGLIGFQTKFLTLTSGSGVMHHVFDHYGPVKAKPIKARHRGVLICNCPGITRAFGLFGLQERGSLFVGPQTDVYEGMIVGLHTRENDLVVNATKEKQLTNMRASGSDENIILTPPMIMSLERAIAFIADDELVEVTPKSIRIRKKFLKENERKRASK